jgi:hypothetical protein
MGCTRNFLSLLTEERDGKYLRIVEYWKVTTAQWEKIMENYKYIIPSLYACNTATVLQ